MKKLKWEKPRLRDLGGADLTDGQGSCVAPGYLYVSSCTNTGSDAVAGCTSNGSNAGTFCLTTGNGYE